MSYGQTNGIPQGSILTDFIAEIVLGYADEQISSEINKNKINKVNDIIMHNTINHISDAAGCNKAEKHMPNQIFFDQRKLE